MSHVKKIIKNVKKKKKGHVIHQYLPRRQKTNKQQDIKINN